MGESYERAYQNMVRVQQLTELEETIEYSLAFQLAQGALLREGNTMPLYLAMCCLLCCSLRSCTVSFLSASRK